MNMDDHLGIGFILDILIYNIYIDLLYNIYISL